MPAQRTLPSTFVLFRKEFDLSSAPIAARGWIAADSRYELSVNGKRVQWGPAPCDPRHLDADPFDLKPFLKAGKNVIGVEVLFYGHGDGTWPGGQPGLIMNLEVQTAEGKSQILTDNSWQALLDRAHPPGQYKRWFLRALQEQFDARLHPYGWNRPDFQLDECWVAAARDTLSVRQALGLPHGSALVRGQRATGGCRIGIASHATDSALPGNPRPCDASRPQRSSYLEARSGRLVRRAHG